MNIYIVTGCAGFIGSHFVDTLFEKDKDCVVLGVDKLTYAGNVNNMSSFWNYSNFYFLSEMIDIEINKNRKLFIPTPASKIGLSTNKKKRGRIYYKFLDIIGVNEEKFYFAVNKIKKLEEAIDGKNYIKYEAKGYFVEIEGNKRIDFIKMTDFPCDNVHIINFAAESHVDRSIENSSPFINTNINGVVNLLELAKNINVEKFIQISTDEVYGSEAKKPHSEKNILLPSSAYSASKASADLLALSYYKTHNVPVCITRSSNNYGPRQFPEKIIPVFIQKLLNSNPVPLYGDGLNIRDWIYVKDNCEAIFEVLNKGEAGEIYNIASGKRFKNIELTKILIEKIKGKFNDGWIESVEDRKGHDREYWLDWTKIQKDLGWSPLVSFGEGIEKTINWYADAFRKGYFN